jgi:hypothetical protein
MRQIAILGPTLGPAGLYCQPDMDGLDVQGIAFESRGSLLAQNMRRIVPQTAQTARRLLPAASQGAIELHQRQRLALLCSHQVELRGKEIRVRRQYFKIAR